MIYFNGLQAYLVVEKILIFNEFPITFLNIQRVGFHVGYFISRFFNGLPVSGFHRVGPNYGQPGKKTTYDSDEFVGVFWGGASKYIDSNELLGVGGGGHRQNPSIRKNLSQLR